MRNINLSMVPETKVSYKVSLKLVALAQLLDLIVRANELI